MHLLNHCIEPYLQWQNLPPTRAGCSRSEETCGLQFPPLDVPCILPTLSIPITASTLRTFTQPSDPSGNLYYARLSTPSGPVYKLGYTTMQTVHERLSFNGQGDEQMIDAVLFFSYFADAYAMEQVLHNSFSHLAPFHKNDPKWYFPLSGNGQSELYFEDVLGLDPNYTQVQANAVRANFDELSKRSEQVPQRQTHSLQFRLVQILLTVTVVPVIKLLLALGRSRQPSLASSGAADRQRCAEVVARIQDVHRSATLSAVHQSSSCRDLETRAVDQRVQKLKLDAMRRNELSAKVDSVLFAAQFGDLPGIEQLLELDLSAINFAAAIKSAGVGSQLSWSKPNSPQSAAKTYKVIFEHVMGTDSTFATLDGVIRQLEHRYLLDGEGNSPSDMANALFAALGRSGPPLSEAKVGQISATSVDISLRLIDPPSYFTAELIVRVSLGMMGSLSFPSQTWPPFFDSAS